MHAFTRRRRWWAAAVTALLTVALSGCTLGYASIPAGYDTAFVGCPLGVDLGPGHLSIRPDRYSSRLWLPPLSDLSAFNAMRGVRFVVTGSSSTAPLDAYVTPVVDRTYSSGHNEAPGLPVKHRVWDGSRSTGVVAVPYQPGRWGTFAGGPMPQGLLVAVIGPADRPWDFAFELVAVDANGNDVGFNCDSYWLQYTGPIPPPFFMP